ncbi:MAG: acyl-CoA synthetase [Solirubrobacteraceae bacterium]
MLFDALHDPAAADRTALAFPDRSLTYAELRGATGRLVAELRDRDRDRVAVVAESRIETCVAVVAGLEAGIAVVPINPKSGETELTHIVTDAAPTAVLTAHDQEVPAALSNHRRIEVALDAPGASAGAGVAEASGGDAGAREASDVGERPALIVYTSGTTGPPKGAVLPRRAIASNLDALAQAWAWTDRDVVAHALPLFHVHGLVIGILGPLRRGGTAMHLGRFSPEAVRQALDGPATMLFGVPTMYRRLADACESSPELAAALGRARLLVSGSAALPAIEHERIRRLSGSRVVERYGLTETLMNTAIRSDGEPAPGTVGPPLPGVEVRIVDDHGDPIETADDETIGELQVRGENVFLGYLNRPEATAAAFHDGWFATGDIVTRTPAGYIRIVGRRATDLIKSGGYKIGAGEIEACLREHPAVQDAAVTGEPDDDLGERVVAWVVAREGGSPTAWELTDHVASMLAPHKRPREVHFLSDLPRNEMGKVQKRRLTPERR